MGGLVTIPHHINAQNFFLVIGTLKIYRVSNFQIRNAVLLTVINVLCLMFPQLTCFITGSLYVLTPFAHFTPTPPTPANHQTVLSCLGIQSYFLDSTYK